MSVTREPARPGDITVLLILAFAFGVVFLARNALGYLSPFIARDLELPNKGIGMLAAAFSLTWAISGFAITALDRGRRQGALLVALLFALGMASVASGFAATFFILILARLAGGIFSGPVLPLTQSFAATLGRGTHRGLRMGVVQGLGGGLIGAVLAPLLLIPVAAHWSWRDAFMLVAAVAILSAGLLARVLPTTFLQPEKPFAQPDGGATRDETDGARPSANIIVCCLISAMMVGWLILTLTFFPIYLVSEAHLAPAKMGAVMSLMGVGSITAGFIVPYLSDRYGRRRIMILFALVGVLSPLGVVWAHGMPALLVASVLIGSLAGGTFPLFMAVIPSMSVSSRRLARSIGLVQGVGEIAGGVIAPLAGGWAADQYGLGAPLKISLAMALIAGAVGLALTESESRPTDQ